MIQHDISDTCATAVLGDEGFIRYLLVGKCDLPDAGSPRRGTLG